MKNNCTTSGVSLNLNTVQKAVKTAGDSTSRSNNLIAYGVEEDEPGYLF